MSSTQYDANDRVEIVGLTTGPDAAFNGQAAVVMQHAAGADTVQLCTASGEVKQLPLTNVAKLVFNPIDCVEVHGLTSDDGKAMNGLIGVVKAHVPGKGRYEVRLSGKLVNLKPENLKKVSFATDAAVAKPQEKVWKPPTDLKLNSTVPKRKVISTISKSALVAAKARLKRAAEASTGKKQKSAAKAEESTSPAVTDVTDAKPKAKGRAKAAAKGAAKKKALVSKAKAVLRKKGARVAKGTQETDTKDAATPEDGQSGKSAKVRKAAKPDVTKAEASESDKKARRSTISRKKEGEAAANVATEEKTAPNVEAVPKKRAKAKAAQKKEEANASDTKAEQITEATENKEVSVDGAASSAKEDESTKSEAAAPKKRARAAKAMKLADRMLEGVDVPAEPAASPEADSAPAKKRGRTSKAPKEAADTSPATPSPQPKSKAADDDKEADEAASASKATKTPKARARKAAKQEGDDKAEAEAATSEVATPAKPAQKKAPRNASKADAQEEKPDSGILEKAEKLGYTGALQNLMSRDNIKALGLSAEKLLAALEASDGLVNKAKAALLGA